MFTRGSFSKTGSGRNKRCRVCGKGYASRSVTVCKKLKTHTAMNNAGNTCPRVTGPGKGQSPELSRGAGVPPHP